MLHGRNPEHLTPLLPRHWSQERVTRDDAFLAGLPSWSGGPSARRLPPEALPDGPAEAPEVSGVFSPLPFMARVKSEWEVGTETHFNRRHVRLTKSSRIANPGLGLPLPFPPLRFSWSRHNPTGCRYLPLGVSSRTPCSSDAILLTLEAGNQYVLHADK